MLKSQLKTIKKTLAQNVQRSCCCYATKNATTSCNNQKNADSKSTNFLIPKGNLLIILEVPPLFAPKPKTFTLLKKNSSLPIKLGTLFSSSSTLRFAT